jgi:prepilin-type N-terminal cleavage/methylation domain-containing protein
MSINAQRFSRSARAGFTLAEVLAALLLMAILVPVAMHGVSVASRAGTLGQRKATAMRIAERVLDEAILTGRVTSGAANGTIVDGDLSYPWTLKSQPWSEDTMTQVTVRVYFELQGETFDVAATTLYDPNANAAVVASTTP